MFSHKKIHYLIPISIAVAAFQVLIAVTALTINWMQLQEIKESKAQNFPIQQEIEVNNQLNKTD